MTVTTGGSLGASEARSRASLSVRPAGAGAAAGGAAAVARRHRDRLSALWHSDHRQTRPLRVCTTCLSRPRVSTKWRELNKSARAFSERAVWYRDSRGIQALAAMYTYISYLSGQPEAVEANCAEQQRRRHFDVSLRQGSGNASRFYPCEGTGPDISAGNMHLHSIES